MCYRMYQGVGWQKYKRVNLVLCIRRYVRGYSDSRGVLEGRLSEFIYTRRIASGRERGIRGKEGGGCVENKGGDYKKNT